MHDATARSYDQSPYESRPFAAAGGTVDRQVALQGVEQGLRKLARHALLSA
jgi:hypothetical protein